MRDSELLERCVDLIGADNHHDRVLREASTILENRIRTLTNLDAESAVPLMQQAFSANSPVIVVSSNPKEQRGAMELFSGAMGLFRNSAGHRLLPSTSRERAQQFLVMVDLLLALVEDATDGGKAVEHPGRT